MWHYRYGDSASCGVRCACLWPSYCWYSLHLQRDGQAELTCVASYILRCFTCLLMVTHPSTNWARHWPTSLMQPKLLPSKPNSSQCCYRQISFIPYSRCSCSRPCSFILLASCWAFLLSRQILDAYLFFSREDKEHTSAAVLEGALMMAVSRCSSPPIWSKRRGFASLSSADLSLWCPECFTNVRDRRSVTGSWKCDSMCGSNEDAKNRPLAGRHFGPFDWTLYSQKYCFCASKLPLHCNDNAPAIGWTNVL